MKLLNKKHIGILSSLLLIFWGNYAFSQDTQKSDLNVSLNYFINNNKIPYLLVWVKTKVDGKFKPVKNVGLHLFLNKDSASALIGNVITNDKGEATAIIPASLKNEWDASVTHTFIATSEASKQFEATRSEISITKAKILIDTASDKKIIATVFEMKDSTWAPVKGVELKISVERFDAYLPVNETETFTTDSTGQASADFKRNGIPGDTNGNITLVATIEDNGQYGNLLVEKTVPWGTKLLPDNSFNRRTLFATRDKTPAWLLLIAYSIIIVVWGILVLLVKNIFKIKKLGQDIA